MGQDRSVLVNFVYCPPIGHAIEALHYCHGYHHANPGLRIGLALNADTPAELAALCPYVGDVYQIPVDISDPAYDPAAALPTVPTGWDWVVDDDRGHQPDQRMAFPGLARYYDQAGDRFSATGSIIGTAGAAPPATRPARTSACPCPTAGAPRLDDCLESHVPARVSSRDPGSPCCPQAAVRAAATRPSGRGGWCLLPSQTGGLMPCSA